MNSLTELRSTFETVTVGQCYACESAELERRFTRSFFDLEFHWVECQNCGLLFQNPKLTRESLNAVYNSKLYWQDDQRTDDGRRMGYNQYQKDDSLRIALGHQRVKLLQEFVESGRVLEIGCATGSFVKAAKDAGFESSGVELSEEAATYGRSHYGIDIEVGDFDFDTSADESFEAVAFWGCDSNFYEPQNTLGKIHRILKPDGVLCFNFWDFSHPLRPLLLGDNKLLYNSMVCFSRKNIQILLERLGFEIETLRSEWRRVTLDSVLAWTGHHRILNLVRKLGVSEFPIWLPALTSYVCVAKKVR